MNVRAKIYKNFIISSFSQIITIILAVIIPRFILTGYGSEINGLLQTIGQLFAYLSLLEGGIGTVTRQALYKTLSKNDISGTNAILSATNIYYKRIGFIYLIAVMILGCLYPIVIKSNISPFTIFVIVILHGIGRVISFFFQAKYWMLIQAEGKNYVKTSLGIGTNILKDVLQIILFSKKCDVILVNCIGVLISLINMLFIAYYIKKYYKWINLKVKPDFNSISQGKNVVIHKIAHLVFNNTDCLLLSIFCGLKVVSVYSMYLMLFSMVSVAQGNIGSSINFSLGQLFHSNKEKFNILYDCYELFYVTIVFILYTIANFFILPFIKLYTSGINDIEYIDRWIPLLFVIFHLLSSGRNAAYNVIIFAGHFKQTQFRAVAEMMINLIVSLIGVYFWGIYGVLFGTIVALLYRANDIIFYACHKILKRSVVKSYCRWGINFILFICITILSNVYIQVDLGSYFKIAIWFLPYSILIVIIYFAFMFMIDFETMKNIYCLVLKKSNR